MLKTGSPPNAILARIAAIVFECDVYRSFGLFLVFCAVAVPASGQTPVLTQHNDNARTGQNTSETILNTSNVNVNQFGKLFAMASDGQVYAQPLYVPGVTINGEVHNVIILATENDSVYAYDADSSGAPLWKASMVDAAHGAGTGEMALNSATTTFCTDTQPKVGITSTPVIDPTLKTVYVEAKSTDGTNYFHRLHALDLLTGNEKTPGPVVIAATVSGTGDGSLNGQLAFNNLNQLNRPGLLLMNGTIYIAYASHCDFGSYHGWLFAYDAATFAQKSVYVTTPNGGLGGFWMSGAGVAADALGNIFIASGNGTFDTTNVPAGETGDTILKLGTANQGLTLLDYFTPYNQLLLENTDSDLGSGGVLLLPDQPGPFPHILVEAGKEGNLYVINRDQMTTNNSHYCPAPSCTSDPEIIEETGRNGVGIGVGMFNLGAYWNNTLYFWGVQDVLKSIPITNGLPDFKHITVSTPELRFPGAGLSVSSNGTTPGSAIVWAIDGTQWGAPGPGPGPAVLYAYDATNILTMLYSSAQNATRDSAGNAVKFVVPTVAKGKVYVGTSTEVDVYGLVGTNPLPQISSIAPSSATVGGAAFTLTLTGTGFVAGAIVNFGSNPAITPSSVTSTQIVATISAADIATAGTVNVTVTNPAGGGTSNTQTFTINNPAPTETSLSPTSATAGGAAFTLTVNGTGFVSTSVLKFNGATKITTFVNATQLTAAITAADIATAGTATVTVTNPPPGGGTSATLSFTINAVSVPALTSIAPTIATVSGTAFTLSLTGTGFVTGATVNFGSNPAITPSSVTSTQIVATIPAADIAAAGTVKVTVTNPSGGGTSNAQTFTVNNPAPTATSLSPTSATAGGAAFTVTVNGTGFVSTSLVKFNGATKTTTFVSTTKLTAAIIAADIATAGTATVTVTNPAPGGGTSGTLSFTISAAAAPTLISMSPTSATAGGAAFTLSLTGTGFVAGAVVNFGSNPAITPSSVTSTQIVATIPATDIATAGTVNVTVTNPAGGGTSNAQTFTINNPAPTETSLSPTSAAAGGAAFTLTVNGTGFVSTSVVKFNGAAKTTTFASATQLTAAITAGDIATAGTATVAVTNPAPSGTSNAVSFTINNSVPTLSSLSPSSAVAGSAAFTLTVTGVGFVSGATVNFNGAGKTTTFVSSSQVTAAVSPSDIVTAGTVNVTVTNPAPTAGPSAAQVFTISLNNPVPAISSLGATHAPGGAAFALTINGANFEANSVVNFNGKPETTTFNSGTKLSATIPASDVAVAGSMNLTVTNPAPGGGTSPAFPFTVDGYTIGGPAVAPLSHGHPAMIQITATPTANGFPNSISFSVSGLPAGSTASFSPATLTPNGNATPTTLTITDGTSAVSGRSTGANPPGEAPIQLLLAMWVAAIVGGFSLRLQARAIPIVKRYAALALFALILLTGSVLSGCALNVTNSPSPSTSQLTVTATSGTLTQMFGITLTVTH
jgi:hypothetical protein